MSSLGARSRSFARWAGLSMLVPAVVLSALWYLSPTAWLSHDEQALWRKVRAGQGALALWRDESRIANAHPEHDFSMTDPHRTGMIGVEWSPITTTLGPLEAKRTAADPLWSVRALRHFRLLGLKKGDRVALLSSSSFPGLVFSLVAAAEHAGLEILWIHSLGASTWGANMPEMLWPRIAYLLRRGGFMSARPDFYTLGGGGEIGLGLPHEGVKALEESAAEDGVSLLRGGGLEEMIERKRELTLSFAPRLVISVGGSHTAFGDEVVPPGGGLYLPEESGRVEFGSGVLRDVLASGVPVLHLLDLRSLSSKAGIPYDGTPRPRFTGAGRAASVLGLLFYALCLIRFKRWRRDE